MGRFRFGSIWHCFGTQEHGGFQNWRLTRVSCVLFELGIKIKRGNVTVKRGIELHQIELRVEEMTFWIMYLANGLGLNV